MEALLTHCVPNLARFEVRVDGGDWQTVGRGVRERVFNGPLHAGLNAIRVRGVNALELATRESVVALEYVPAAGV